MNTHLSSSDRAALQARGISEEQLNNQLRMFAEGFGMLRIIDSARVGAGIRQLDDHAREAAVEAWDKYLTNGGMVTKFVPASGAASRMFKSLFAFVESADEHPASGSDVAQLLADIHKTAFCAELDTALTRMFGQSLDQLLAAGRDKDIIRGIIAPQGLNYGNLPKGLLTFHHSADGGTRTPLEEQLAEGAQTASMTDGTVNVHFTVSANHRKLFEKKIEEVLPGLSKEYGVKYNVSLSEQKPSTDTVAVNPDNTPFRDEQGNIVFRPGGHGALIANLGDIDSEVIFIKNIDNVVPDSYRDVTIEYKKVIGGVLIQTKAEIDRMLTALRHGGYTRHDLERMVDYLNRELCIATPDTATMPDNELARFVEAKLSRPIRVCGMVRNEGEPGGGPYIAVNPDGTASPQILESSQIDTSVPEYAHMMARATHFNPVDLVCYVKDIDGNSYDLPSHVDPATGFISSKSLHGRELKALELPGLWNGAMSDWNTIFVEVPAKTFNPVKTVNDLLRPAHRC